MGSLVAAAAAALITFWPQAGVIGQDLYVGNFVDLDPAAGATLDPFCGHRTYDTHTGDDVTFRSFREITIGLPVFSVSDGTVVESATGGFDFHYGTNTSPYDNHVSIRTADGVTFVYGHLRHDVKLRRGDVVRAGQQVGWAASSGNSSWPHTHFTELLSDGTPRDPFAGPCRAGARDFLVQPQLRDSVYVRNVVVSAKPFAGKAQLPWDQATRTGTFARGTRTVYIRAELGEWSGGDVRVQVVRPDGSVATETAAGTPDGVGQGHGQAAFDYTLRVPFAVVGTWRLRYVVDGATLSDTPLRVGAGRNRPPSAVSAGLVFAGANDAVQCVVSTTLAARDPDYDIVRYRYRWLNASGKVLRAVTSAGLTDILVGNAVPAGQRLRCDVTPSDGKASGPTASAAGQVPGDR